MSGNYHHIWSAWDLDVSDEDRKARLLEGSPIRGRTHGCSCCSVEENIDMISLDDHIRSLEIDLNNAKMIREKLQAWEIKALAETSTNSNNGN